MKAVIFDFDGTLTQNSPDAWYSIWRQLGYSTNQQSYYAQLYRSFLNGEINHTQWHLLTCDAFKQKNMTKNVTRNVKNEIQLIHGLDETMQELKNQGLSLHIVSGNIKEVIEDVLGDKTKYFDSIQANRFLYDNDNKLSYIIPTQYDFQGKAQFVFDYINAHESVKPDEIAFVGDGINDEWVHLSGCKTICINPTTPNYDNKEIWHHTIHKTPTLTAVLPNLLSKDLCNSR